MSRCVIVSDTSPLHYLILIGAAELLPRITREVLIPPAVARELADPSTPEEVRNWMSAPPAWLKLAAPHSTDDSLGLDPGETEAISLALERGILTILIDERKGFRVAAQRGLQPIGLLAVLEFAASNRWISFEEHLSRLRNTTFRLNERLLAGIRERIDARASR